MTWISLHYCSAERWRDLKERISICQLSPAFAPLLHLSQTSQWSLRMLQDTLNKAHGWVESRLHRSGFLLAVVQPDNRMVEWVDHFIFNNRHLSQIWAEYGSICNKIYGMKELCLWIILSYITLIMNQSDVFMLQRRLWFTDLCSPKEQFSAVKSSPNTSTWYS